VRIDNIFVSNTFFFLWKIFKKKWIFKNIKKKKYLLKTNSNIYDSLESSNNLLFEKKKFFCKKNLYSQ